jgi:hypothetical protein
MKVGDLVSVPCTCGKSHGHDPKIAVIVQKDSNGMVQILLEGHRLWVDPIIELELFNESR